MQGGVVELAMQAAAAARAERGERRPGAARFRLPVRHYRGVMKRGHRYVAEIMDTQSHCPVNLGAYATPEEAAYAYDAAARIMHGDMAMTNFPEPPPAPAPPAAGGGGGAAPRAHARVRRLLGHARVRAPLNGPPVGDGAPRRVFSAQQPLVARFRAAPLSGPYHRGATPAYSRFVYRRAAGPAFAAAGGSNSAGGFSGPALTAAGGSNGGAELYGKAPMIGPEPEVPMPMFAASSALSSSDKKEMEVFIVNVPASANPKLVIIIESDRNPVVADNFTGVDGAAFTSSAAPPAVPPLGINDLMEAEEVRRSADEGAP